MEHEKIAPFHRLTPCFCRNRPALFKCTGLVVAFRLLCFEMSISQRQGARRHVAEKFILTHTHEMSYMRCFKDIATAGTGLEVHQIHSFVANFSNITINRWVNI